MENKAMLDILKLIFDICLFKKGPQDVPHSQTLLHIMLLVDAVVSFLMLSMSSQWPSALLQAGVGVILVFGFSWIMLFLGRRLGRFYQTSCALLGTDALISFFALPGTASLITGRMTLLAFSVMLGLMAWHWAVTGHIIRNALEKPWAFSLGLAFLYILGSYQVMALLFPGVTGTE
jgi:hypothetical protein